MAFTRSEIKEIFQTIDSNNDGELSIIELYRAVKEMNILSDESEAEEMTEFIMKKYDKDKNGKLSQKEFIKAFSAFKEIVFDVPDSD